MTGTLETSSPSWGRRHRTAALAVFCVALLVACPVGAALLDEDAEYQDADALLPVVILALGLIIGATAGIKVYHELTNLLSDGDLPDGSTDDSVAAALRAASAQLVASNYSTASGLWSKLAANDAQLWAFVEAYFDRMAEIAAAQIWSDSATYDGDTILVASSLIANSLTYNYNLIGAWNEFTLSWSDYRDLWAAEDGYESMEVAYVTDSSSWTSSGVFSSELMRYVTPTSSSNLVYIEVYDEDTDGYTKRTNVLYSVGGEGTLTLVSSGTTWTLSEGANDLSGMTSGWYELGTGVTYICANLSGSVSSNGLMPNACMLIRNGSTYAYAYESGGSYVLVKDGNSETTSTLGMSVSYDDADGNTVTYATIDLGTVLSAYTDVSDALNDAALSADYAGEAAWAVYDALETSSTLISPSSITTGTQTEYELGSELAAVIYLAALQQLAGLGADATSDGIVISEESLTLYCYGDIYYNGVLIAEDAVYTPFVYADATVAVGTQTLAVNGIAMIWTTGVDSLDDWDGTTDGSCVIDISGCTLDTSNIYADGVEVSSVDLTVASMETLGLIGYDIPTPTPTPTTVDVTVLVMIIMILIGAMLAVVGWYVSNTWLMIIGAIVAVIGIVIPGTIADLIW